MGAKRKFDHDAILDAYLSGMSYRKIGERFGCKPYTVRSIASKYGFQRSPQKSRTETVVRDDTPPTAVAIDGYVLPDEESASIFRHISARKKAIEDTLVSGEPLEDISFIFS